MEKILIVEDKPESRELLSSYLKAKKYKTFCAANGKQALEILKSNPVDLIISDILMPEMDGYMLCKKVKSEPQWAEIPFIFYSATFTTRMDEIFAIKLGAARFVRKPLDPKEFLKIIQEILRSHKEGTLKTAKYKYKEEENVLQVYNDRIVKKLEKKVAELENSEMRLANAMKIAKMGYWEYDVEKNLFIFDDHFYAIYHTTAEEVGGYQLKPQEYAGKFVHPEDREIVEVETRKAMEASDPNFHRHLEHRILYADGGVGYISVTFFITKDNQGRIIKTFGINQDITEQKKIEKELLDKETQCRKIFEAANDGFLIFDLNGIIREANSAACQIYGYPYEELIGLTGKDIIIPEYYHLFEKFLKETIKGGSFYCESIELRKDGSTFHSEIRGNVFQLEGQPHLLAAVRDITERKQAEKELQESEGRYRAVVENSQSGVLIVGDNYRFTYVNDTLCKMLLCRQEDIIGHDFREFLDEESKSLVSDMYEKRRRGEDIPSRYEFNVIRLDGEKRRVEINSKIVKDTQGRPRIIAQLMDITERKEAEENIRRFTEGAHAILWRGKVTKLADESAGCRGFDWNVNYINLENISKFLTLAEDTGKNLEERYHNSILPDDQLTMEKTSSQALQSNADGYEHEFRLEDAKGNLHWMHEDVRINRLDDTHFELIGFTIDISESKRMETEKRALETQLLQSQKMEAIGKLAGGIAHDFNNLLTVIMGNAQLVMMKYQENDSNYHELKQILNASTRAANLTKQLLLFSRKHAMEMKTINLNKTISDLLKMIKRLIGENINIVTELEENLWNIDADESNLEQALVNLVVNASDAMPDGGTLTIRTENALFSEAESKTIRYGKPGKFVHLSITDTGGGIPEEMLDQIFEPFFTTKEVGKGTGLGLSVVYGIIKKHNGWIDVQSEVDSGSVFDIYLPASDSATFEPRVSDIQPEYAHRGNGETILIVEDEKDLLDFTAALLRQNGYTPLAARNAGEALELVAKEKNNIKLIIPDIVLPDTNGLQLVDQILSRYPGIPTIFCSGYFQKNILDTIRQSQNFHYIQKPFQVNVLLARIHNALAAQNQNRK
ncbi:MAG: PAS domain S-box protein [Fidelibacterota bacterium]